MKKAILFLLIISASSRVHGQLLGKVQGYVKDEATNEDLIGATITDEKEVVVAITDENGFYSFEINVGSHNFAASYTSYSTSTKYNIVVTSGNINQVNFQLTQETIEIEGVEVTFKKRSSAAASDIVTPLSVQRLSTEEIKNNPGGNFDISRVVQALPGVGGSAGTVGGFRNDIVIRGGGPNENVYYLDGIEIPVLNHFSTQGSAGGPAGILNVSFIEDVKLSTSAFNARIDNALSSVLEFDQRNGNREKLQGNFRLSATEVAATFDGPIGKKAEYIVSARRSYLELLFTALDLPIRPNYWDFQNKVSWQLNKKTSLSIIGVASIDEFSFKPSKNASAENVFILNSNPLINQWSYTIGANLKRQINNGYLTFTVSRNDFQNRLDKFENNDLKLESQRNLKSVSNETENKLKFSIDKYVAGWKYAYGLSAQYVSYKNEYFNLWKKELKDENGQIIQEQLAISFDSDVNFLKFGAFGQVSRSLFNDKLALSFGIRSDVNTFTQDGGHPLKTLSPRLNAMWRLAPKWKVNATWGRYHKIPIYTVLGVFEDNNLPPYVNSDNRYISVVHKVLGLEYLPKDDLRFTMEAFIKDYDKYPVSVTDGTSLANQGVGFGVIGIDKFISNGRGKTYGIELYVQQKLTRNIFGVISYTYVRSNFSGIDGKLIPSAWDNRNLISMIFGKKFKRSWELGVKYRYAGGAPYTPFDEARSRLNYLSQGNGTLDYSKLNTLRLKAFSQLDLRIDKKWNFKNWTFDLFIDIQNVLLSKNPAYPQYTFDRNEDGSNYITNDGKPIKQDGSNAVPLILKNEDAIATPSIGFIVEF